MSGKNSQAKVLWFTGLSGSGKSTIASITKEHMESLGKKAVIYDGDAIRAKNKHLGFNRADILENNRQILALCLETMQSYDYIIVSVITPFVESRRNARKSLGELYCEIYVKASIETCNKRDVKGLYKKAIAGEITTMIGMSEELPYETPENPDIVLDTESIGIEECFNKIKFHLKL